MTIAEFQLAVDGYCSTIPGYQKASSKYVSRNEMLEAFAKVKEQSNGKAVSG